MGRSRRKNKPTNKRAQLSAAYWAATSLSCWLLLINTPSKAEESHTLGQAGENEYIPLFRTLKISEMMHILWDLKHDLKPFSIRRLKHE